MEVFELENMLAEIAGLKGDQLFYDVHNHPFDVLFDRQSYHQLPATPGVFSSGTDAYLPPQLGPLELQNSPATAGRQLDERLKRMACQLKVRRLYRHTGPGVFAERMQLSLIDRSLLLPVPGNNEPEDQQFEAMLEFFGDDERFLFGYSLPNRIPNQELSSKLRQIVSNYAVRVVKIHPSVTGIDLGSHAGVERLEAILDAAEQNRRPVIIHGGLSPDCQNPEAVAYGMFRHLQQLDWSTISQPVVIAHGGCFGHSADEAREEIIPGLAALLEQHQHLAIDISGIDFDTLCPLLRTIAPERILFGTDALYEDQWATLVRLWVALRQVRQDPASDLLRITATNPTEFLSQQ